MLIPIDHIQITVRDMKAAEPFYDKRKPGTMHHLAFRAKDRAEVDKLYEEIGISLQMGMHRKSS